MQKLIMNFENKKRLELSEIKKVEFEILKNFKKICDDNNLKYFLAYGSLLGAVRHKGFIPWDDDIDVMMPRPDYNKFIEFLKNNDTKYKLINFKFKKKCDTYYSKFVDDDYIVIERDKYIRDGIFIDIFPLDPFANSIEEAKKNYKKFPICRRIVSYNVLGKSSYSKNNFKKLIKFLFYLFAKIIGLKYCFEKYDKFINKKDYYQTKYKSTFLSNGAKRVYSDEEIGNGTFVEFEGEIFNTFSNYGSILEKEYGDYMKIPEKKDRVTHSLIVYKAKNSNNI